MSIWRQFTKLASFLVMIEISISDNLKMLLYWFFQLNCSLKSFTREYLVLPHDKTKIIWFLLNLYNLTFHSYTKWVLKNTKVLYTNYVYTHTHARTHLYFLIELISCEISCFQMLRFLFYSVWFFYLYEKYKSTMYILKWRCVLFANEWLYWRESV